MLFCRESSLNVSNLSIMLPNGEEGFIQIEPGEAFGRGNQPSTRVCIKVMESIFKERKVEIVLDVGCGTGVLSICAALLGANRVLALDVDPLAVEETRINIKKNGFTNIQVVYDSLKGVHEKFDLVIANLGTTEILNISDELKYKLKDEGFLLLSGIWLDGQKEMVIQRFKELGLCLDEELYEGGWIALSFRLN
ncbi:MAG TPA: 50S ribosomal protein L11 methyltransferase [Thermodesulfobacteriota bacterium]|nr:50S ribosomal protein L11 methyltransferase [Thermodesulfobacteriota bacterium]